MLQRLRRLIGGGHDDARRTQDEERMRHEMAQRQHDIQTRLRALELEGPPKARSSGLNGGASQGHMITNVGPSFAYAILVLQPLFAVIGVGFNLYLLQQALYDLSLTKYTNGGRRLVAQAHVEWEVIRLCVQLLLLIMGLLVFISPPLPQTVFERTHMVILSRTCLILATLLLSAKSVLGLRHHALIRQWMAEQWQDEAGKR